MTLREYIDNLNSVIEEHPEYLDFQVIYAADNTGTSYHPVVNVTPEVGMYDKEDETFEYYNDAQDIESRGFTLEECDAISIN